jgi:hypothetical protein
MHSSSADSSSLGQRGNIEQSDFIVSDLGESGAGAAGHLIQV